VILSVGFDSLQAISAQSLFRTVTLAFERKFSLKSKKNKGTPDPRFPSRLAV